MCPTNVLNYSPPEQNLFDEIFFISTRTAPQVVMYERLFECTPLLDRPYKTIVI